MLTTPKLILAPMAGITDLAFRTVCAECGADYAISEMVSAKALYFGDEKSKNIADISKDLLPTSIQIFGSDPNIMAFAAKELEKFNPISIDINMGCPMPKIVNNGEGSALMKDPYRVGDIVCAVRSATNLPVSVKMRSGWDETSINAVQIAKICEKNGANAITVHARTKKQLYAGQADWRVIKAVKESVSIPVIGNGDVVDSQSAASLIDYSFCDAIMIGRSSLGDPWIFSRIKAFFRGEKFIEPSWDEKKKVMIKHLELLTNNKGERVATLEARKHLSWYLKGVENACAIRNEINRTVSMKKMLSLIDL